MYLFVLVIQILLAVGITVLVLLQRSEGGMGGLTGQSANSFLTARQAGNALSKLTKYFFIAFCAATILLTIMAANNNHNAPVSVVPSSASQTQE